MSSTRAAQETIDVKRLRHVCSTCSLSELCLPMGLSRGDMERLDDIVSQDLYRARDHLFRTGDEFRVLYAVRSGTLKSYVINEQGEETVLGFHLPGELVGLDAIYPSRHLCNAVALDTSSVCKLPFDRLTQLAGQMPSLQRQMLRLLSKDISGFEARVGDFPVDQRLAAFLINISRRFEQRGFSARKFRLLMSRKDVGNYLGIAFETVSRALRGLEERRLIQVDGKEVELLDVAALEKLGGCE